MIKNLIMEISKICSLTYFRSLHKEPWLFIGSIFIGRKNRGLFHRPLQFAAVMSATMLLAACGGGSSGSGNSTNSSPQNKQLSGTLVEPENSSTTSAKALNPVQAKTAAKSCSNVPEGYSPLVNTPVHFLDGAGAELKTVNTDDCGMFSASVPLEVEKVTATSADNHVVEADVAVFEDSGGKIASAIPTGASYQISAVQKIGDRQIAVTVTDSVTRKAVIGIPRSAFGFEINATPAGIQHVQSAANSQNSASVVIVLDASGSMDEIVNDAQGNPILDASGIPYTRFRLTALAAHTYLDAISPRDETAFIIFNQHVDFVNDDLIKQRFTMLDGMGNPVEYNFSADGFSSDASSLRFIVDAYNPESRLWGQFNADAIHPDTPNFTMTGDYPWRGTTAVYDAIMTALDKANARTNTRKLVITMTDGADNASIATRSDVIDTARQIGIPVHTIAYGIGARTDEDSMREVANQTHGSFYSVKSTDITAAFRAIQTGVSFQYLITLDQPVQVGDKVNAIVTQNGTPVSREFTVQ